MGISVADNFDHKSKKPLDARTSYATLALMKAVTDANMNEGCLAYCAETDKYYKFLSTNTVDADTGRWREFSSGGGSSEDENAYHTTDSAETTIADTDYFPFQDVSANGKRKSLWSNIKSVLKTYFDTIYDLNKSDIPFYATSSTGASTTAKTATVSRGTFTLVAGAKVTVKFTNSNTASAPTLNVGSTGAKNIKYIDESGTVTTPSVWWNANEVVDFVYDGTQFIMMPTYTMALTPKGNKIQPSSIYSTSETMIGKWTDGRPIYQKIITGSVPTTSTDGTPVSTTISLGATVKEIVFGVVRVNNSGNNYILNDAMPSSSVIALYARATFRNNSHSSNPNTLSITNTMVSWNGLPFTAIIQYTKTTDSTSSYNLANPTDYSTSEKVVGTWIDGSTLYQKTYSVTTPSTVTLSAELFSVSGMYIKNIEGVVCYEGTSSTSVATLVYATGGTTVTSVVNSCMCYVASNKFYMKMNDNDALGKPAYITIKYTKS